MTTNNSPVGGNLLLVILMASVIVAWSPRYWPVAALHVGVFLVGLLWLASRVAMTNPTPICWNWLFVPIFFAAFWGILQLAFDATVYRFATEREIFYWSANAGAMFLASQFLQSPRQQRNFLTALASFAGLLAVVGILQYFTSPNRIYWIFPLDQQVKAVGPFVYRNQFAALVELVLPIALYRVLDEPRRRWIFSLLSAVLVAAVVATASRTGTVLVVSEVVAIFLLAWRRGLVPGRTLTLALSQVVALSVILALATGYQDVWSRFRESDPLYVRTKLSTSTLQMVRARPLLGFGLGSWRTVYPEYATFDDSRVANEAHNDWLQWSADGGIFFALALAILALGSARLGWRTLWGLGVFVVFLHSFVDYPTREPAVGAILFAMMGTMLAATGKGQPNHR